jgi:hypothetical protein
MKEWVQLELSNDWGSYYWRDAGLYNGQLACYSKQAVVFKKEKIRVKWPGGRESEEFLIDEYASMEVGDHGQLHSDLVESCFPVLGVIENDKIVKVPLSDVLIWHEEIQE